MPVVDASVAVRWFVDAPPSPSCVAVLHAGEPLLAPDLVTVESANATWKLCRAGVITLEHARQLVAALPRAFDRLVPVDELVGRAFAIAHALGHPVYDACYLALAERERMVLVTTDFRLHASVHATPWESSVQLLAIG